MVAWDGRCVPLFLIAELDTEERYHFEGNKRMTGSTNDLKVYKKHITAQDELIRTDDRPAGKEEKLITNPAVVMTMQDHLFLGR